MIKYCPTPSETIVAAPQLFVIFRLEAPSIFSEPEGSITRLFTLPLPPTSLKTSLCPEDKLEAPGREAVTTEPEVEIPTTS